MLPAALAEQRAQAVPLQRSGFKAPLGPMCLQDLEQSRLLHEMLNLDMSNEVSAVVSKDGGPVLSFTVGTQAWLVSSACFLPSSP